MTTTKKVQPKKATPKKVPIKKAAVAKKAAAAVHCFKGAGDLIPGRKIPKPKKKS